jgi:NADPH:quinone reductase-like Zn-dependent oxidoreductase/acyl carrier protein
VGDSSFELYSEGTGATDGKVPWILNAKGTIRPSHAQLTPVDREPETPEQLKTRCVETFSGEDFYRAMAERGLQYGPSFQSVEQIWRRDGEAVGRLRLPDLVQSEASAYQIHPALLDACFQVLAGTLPGDGEEVLKEGVYLPVGLGKLRLFKPPSGELWVHALFQGNEELDGDTLKGDVFLIDEEGQVVLEALGFRIQRVERELQNAGEENLDDWLYRIQWEPQDRKEEDGALAPLPPEDQQTWVIFADGRGVSQALQELLEARGETCITVSPGEAFSEVEPGRYQLNPGNPDDFQQLLASALGPDGPACRGVIHLWSLDAAAPEKITLDSLQETHRLGSFSVLHLVQALAKAELKAPPRLWLVTGGSQAVSEGAGAAVVDSVEAAQAPVWGLGKVISFEHPELRCKKVDLSPGSERSLAAEPPTLGLAAEPLILEIKSLFQELWSENDEDQVALRGAVRYVPRLVRYSAEAADNLMPASPDEQAFKLEIPTPGILDGFRLRANARREPGPGEVEIRVKAVGLNFRDVMIAMDLLPPVFEGSLDVGFECAGTIVAVGEGVEGLQVGDGVVAGAPACFGSYVTTPDYMVARKPEYLNFEEAATIPIAFLTAYYALNFLGRIRKGDRVLIHAASGGVGQAAVQIARQVGAEIFATAGSPEKREFLRSQGIQHIMDSRSLDFVDEVMSITGGEGVDLVLNSLAGEFITRGITVLRAGGRFLEIGKVDILQNTQLGLQLFDNNIAFFAIDLSKLIIKEPAFIRTLWTDAMSFFEDHTFNALPLKVFPISEAVDAFRYMAQAKHIGKVVISLEQDEVLVAPAQEPVTFHPEGSYLITGGNGGLGLAAAQWMVERGARHLALMGRSGVSPAAQAAIEAMEARGAQVRVVKGDVAQEEQVAGVLDEIRKSMPPLKGIIHSAGVLDDGILLQLTPERFNKVMAPKIDGAWNLHQQTLNDPVEMFVLFSSGASVLGSPGQGNYVAANAFLDALAHERRALGLPAVTINWGAWGEVGLATRADRVKHLTAQGIAAFTPQQGVELLGRILEHDQVQMLAVDMNWSKLVGLYSPPFLSHMAEEAAREIGPSKKKGDGLTLEKLIAVEPGKRKKVVEAFLKEQMAKVLRSSPDKIDMHQPLTSLGIDSLMAVELKNRVESDLELAVPVTALLQGPTLSQLAAIVLDQLALKSPVEAEPSPNGQEGEAELLAQLDDLSDEEVDTLLQEMLDEEESDLTARETQETAG